MAHKAKIHNNDNGKLTGTTYMFAGLNNIIDPYNLPIDTGFLPIATNVDIDNSNSIQRRSGFDTVITTTNSHSGWSNNDRAFYVEDTYLKECISNDDIRIIDVLTQPKRRMWYCQCNDVVAYSNGVDFGFSGGNFSQKRTYSPFFKENTKLGICLEFYNGRLYHAINNTIFCTDVFDLEHSDIRFKRVLTVRSSITMIRMVEDGLYVGSEDQVHFLRGNDIQEGGFDLEIVTDYGCILGTDISTTSDFFPEAKAKGLVIVWTSPRGICTGSNSGGFINHSYNIVSIPEATSGCAFLRDISGFRQYVVTLNSSSEYNPYPQPTFTVTTT
jgi:hypothetical protein